MPSPSSLQTITPDIALRLIPLKLPLTFASLDLMETAARGPTSKVKMAIVDMITARISQTTNANGNFNTKNVTKRRES